MFCLLVQISIGATCVTISFGANFGDWCKPAGSSGTESRAEQNRAENEFPLHPGDMVSFRGERFW